MRRFSSCDIHSFVCCSMSTFLYFPKWRAHAQNCTIPHLLSNVVKSRVCHQAALTLTPPPTPLGNLKKVKNHAKLHTLKDPSVLLFSVRPDTTMKYNFEELKSLRSSRASQAPPACVYEPKIIRLKILRHTPDDCENNSIKSLHELMPKSPFSGNWNLDPKLALNLLSQYHRELLFPQYGYANNSEWKSCGNVERLLIIYF